MLVLGQIVSAGFSGDDAYRTHLVAYAAWRRLSLAHAVAQAGDQWAREHGGFFPLQMLAFALWAGDPTSGLALFVQLCLIALNVGTFAVLVRRITRSSAFAWLAVACFFLALELRVTDDAVLGPIVTAPLTLECLLVALLAWISYLASGSGRRLLASLLFFVGAVLADAWTYPTALCFCALAFARLRSRQAAPLIIACAYPCVPAIALLYGYARGYGIPSGFVGHTAAAYARLCGDHVLSALPTIYRATGTLVRDGVSDFGGDHRFHAISHAGIVGWLSACAVALIVAGVLRCSLNEGFSASCTRYAVITAGGLWLSPALIADRACVYPMYFGVALALALTLRRLRDFAPERKPELRDAFAVGAGVVALFVMYGNVRFNTYAVFRHRTNDLPRQHVAEAAQAGLFGRLPANASLAVAGPYPFHVGTDDYRDVRNLFYHYTKRAYRTAAARDIERSGVRPANVWYLRFSAPQQIVENPSVVAAHWSRTLGQTIFTDQAWGYRRYVDEDEASAALDRFARPVRGLQVGGFAAYGRRVMVRAQRRCGPVPVQAVFEPTVARITWGDGFYDPEPFARVVRVGVGTFTDLFFLEPERRFATSRAHLFIERDACAFEPAHMRMTVYADARARLFVRVGAGSKRYVVSPVGVAVDMLVPNHASRRLEVVLQTDAPHESELSTILRSARADYRDIRVLVVAPADASLNAHG
jgi:hypothetical protein